jgi:hypothetical protein
VGLRLAAFDFVTLCYRRPRRPPRWPYNLFCMIHGRDRQTVLGLVECLVVEGGLAGMPCSVLFSRRRFKQCGGRYLREEAVSRGVAASLEAAGG